MAPRKKTRQGYGPKGIRIQRKDAIGDLAHAGHPVVGLPSSGRNVG
jgi:hypothetical protein